MLKSQVGVVPCLPDVVFICLDGDDHANYMPWWVLGQFGTRTIWHHGQFGTKSARRTIWHQECKEDNLAPRTIWHQECKADNLAPGQFGTKSTKRTIWHQECNVDNLAPHGISETAVKRRQFGTKSAKWTIWHRMEFQKMYIFQPSARRAHSKLLHNISIVMLGPPIRLD